MSGDPCPQIDLFEFVHGFVVAGASDDLTDRQWSDFERLLQESDRARHLYAKYVSTLVLLPSVLTSMSDSELPLPLSVASNAEGMEPPSAMPIGFLTTALPGTFGYFSSDWPVAYLVATVIFGIGLLFGALIHVSQPVQVARRSPPVTEDTLVSEPKIEVVGRITGMADCRWADPSTEAFPARTSRWAANTPWLPASWNSPTTPEPKSFCKGRSRMRSNRSTAASSRWAGWLAK